MKTLEKVALFWDVDRAALDEEKHAEFIIRRVLALGDLDDIRWAEACYGPERLAECAACARDLDPRSRNFWTRHFSHA